MGSKKALLIVPNSFPYDVQKQEIVFFKNEFKEIRNIFSNIHILPRNKGEVYYKNLQGANLADDLNQAKTKLTLPHIFKNVYEHKVIIKGVFTQLPNFMKLKKNLSYAKRSFLVKQKLFNYIKKNHLETSEIIVYTYWFTSATLGSLLLKRETDSIDIKVITRAHGKDLHEERTRTNHIPYREPSIKWINKIFLASNHGKEYLMDKYPEYKNKYTVSKLGVSGSEHTNTMSGQRNFKIVSCATIFPVKRVDLILKSLRELAEQIPTKNIIWNHFGKGPLLKNIKNKAQEICFDNLECSLNGYVENDELLRFYRNNSVDLFVSTSKKEGGIPVSMQEAQSFGIPLIGTNVGGIPEIIVDGQNGFLLPQDPSIDNITSTLEDYIELPEYRKKQMRTASVENWRRNFDAKKNFVKHVRMIKQIYESY